jgi:hypothetical protein
VGDREHANLVREFDEDDGEGESTDEGAAHVEFPGDPRSEAIAARLTPNSKELIVD